MFDLVREDLRMSYYRKVGLWRLPIRCLTLRGFRAVVIYRMASWFWRHGMKTMARVMTWFNEEAHAVAIHPDCQIGPGLVLPHGFSLVIGTGVTLGAGAYIFNNTGIGRAKDGGAPHIGDDFVLYAGGQVVGGVRIGDRVTVGINAVVMQDIGDDTSVLPGRQIVLKKQIATDTQKPAVSEGQGP